MNLSRPLFDLLGVFFEPWPPGAARTSHARRRVVPRLEGPLEERNLPTTLPIVGVFSGAYSDVSVSDGILRNDNGTITLVIDSASSVDSMSAAITGSIRITGFAGQDATLPFQFGF